MTAKNDLSEPLVIERTFNAPIAQVWKAITDVEAMREWYFDLKDFKPQVGFEFQFVVEHDGHTYDHRCKITEVIPQKKIAHTWRYAGHEGDSLVTFDLLPEGDKTRLKLTHEGLDSFPKLPAFDRGNFKQGWTQLIGSSLMEYLEEPGHKLVVTREFDAPLELVWKAWTEPAQVKEWLGSGDDMTVESVKMDLRTGGKFRIQQKMADGEYYTAAGTYLEVKAPERLVYTWDWEKDGSEADFGELEGNETQVTVEFQAVGKRTKVALTHKKFASVKSRDSHERGWTTWLAKVAEFIDAK
ncbi:MAG: SRPBCC domain-containing protein [Luteolibacter sp.]|uniref:SRPBCC family protein n=1 Tax=Luteolibacter sp. TaxID=1962973 RepID=UPI003266DFF2